MARPGRLQSMDVPALLALRAQIDVTLADRRKELESQLAALGNGSGVARRKAVSSAGGRGSKLRGIKVAPKYRDAEGNTWAGRGATPKWLSSAVKGGAKLEDFLIDKVTAVKKAVTSKRSPRKQKG